MDNSHPVDFALSDNLYNFVYYYNLYTTWFLVTDGIHAKGNKHRAGFT